MWIDLMSNLGLEFVIISSTNIQVSYITIKYKPKRLVQGTQLAWEAYFSLRKFRSIVELLNLSCLHEIL